MKICTLLSALLLTVPAWAQITTTPARNATAVARTAAVSATLPGSASGAALHLFSAQAGGKKAGATTRTGTTISFAPTTGFRPGETVQAVLTTGTGTSRVWQFTAAAAPSPGTFSTSSSVALGYAGRYAPSNDVVLGDFDGDGDLDLAAIVNVSPGNGIALRFNDGSGTFSAPTVVPAEIGAGGAPTGICTGDVNGDGHLDLVSTNGGGVYALLNSGTGQFVGQPLLRLTLSNSSTVKPRLADADGDGDLDLFVPGRSSSTPPPSVGNVFCCLNNGSGVFAAPRSIAVPNQAVDIALGDLDSDGDMDLTVATGVGVSIRFNDGQGNFSGGNDFTTTYSTRVALADADSDGDLDLFECRQTPNGIFLWRNNGAGNMGSTGTQMVWGCRPWSIEPADVDGDGNPDLVVSDDAGLQKFHVVRRYGLNFGNTPLSLSHDCMYLTSGDIDNDGDIDIVALDTYGRQGFPVAYSYFNGSRRVLAATPARAAMPPRLWPNPVTTGALHLELPAATRGVATLRTPIGQLVTQQSFAGAQVVLNTASLAPGVYLLTVQAGGQLPSTQRVVVE